VGEKGDTDEGPVFRPAAATCRRAMTSTEEVAHQEWGAGGITEPLPLPPSRPW